MKRSQRCSAISWKDFEGHFTMGDESVKRKLLKLAFVLNMAQ